MKNGFLFFAVACISRMIFFGDLCCVETLLDITKFGYEQYQDIIINNKVIKPASGMRRDCNKRYQIIKTVLDKYQRPFTMLDIGASQGYYSFRAAYDYKEAVCVMIESNNPHYPMIGSQLFNLCTLNSALDNIVFLDQVVTVDNLKRLSECESVDVVLAMNIIHWMGNSWKEAIDHILDLGHIVIIETPPPESWCSKEHNLIREGIRTYLLEKNAKILSNVPRHTSNVDSALYIVENNVKFLKRKTWIMPLLEEKIEVCRIDSDFQKKTLTKERKYPLKFCKTTEWIPGINCITFKMASGKFPLKQTVKDGLYKLKNQSHNDWCINNMIIQGNKMSLIDFNDATHGAIGRQFSPLLLRRFQELADLDVPSQFEGQFWEIIDSGL